MGLYHVALPSTAKSTLVEGKDVCIVVAESAAEAKLVAKAQMLLPSDAAWAAATVTELTEASDLAGWRARITINDSSGDQVEQVTVTGVTLTIAETTDGLGDHTVICEFLPPTTWHDPTINFPAFYGTLVHEGDPGDALTVVLNDVTTPELLYQLGSGH